jgi:hypothetical protein
MTCGGATCIINCVFNEKKMKKIAFLLLTFIITECHAQTAVLTPEFKKVISLVASDTIFSTAFPKMMQNLKGLCIAGKKSDKGEENVKCVKESGISTIVFSGSASATLVGIDISFVGLEKCAFVKAEATKKYGKPILDKGQCEAAWSLKPVKNGPERHLTLSPLEPKNAAVLIINQDDEW